MNDLPISVIDKDIEFAKRLQYWWNDNIVDGMPCGDWHIECFPSKAAMIVAQYREGYEKEIAKLNNSVEIKNKALEIFVDYAIKHGAITLVGRNGAKIHGDDWMSALNALNNG